MAIKKNFFCQLYDAGGNSEKRWFVWYYDRKGTRRFIYKGLGPKVDIETRYATAARIMAELRINPPAPKRVPGAKGKTLRALLRTIEERAAINRKKTIQDKYAKFQIFSDFMIDRTGPITDKAIKDFFAHLINKRKVHPTTHNDYRRFLKSLWSWTYPKRENPFSIVLKLPATSNGLFYYSRSQVRLLKGVIAKEDPQLWLFIQFVYYCFLRPNSELRLLKVGDIMLEEKKIRVRDEISKNRKTQYVIIPDVFCKALKRYGIESYNANLHLFTTHQMPGPVYPSYNYFYERHRVYLKRFKFEKGYALYSWKHTGAVALVKAGVHIKQIQLQLRHHSLDQVNTYLRNLGLSDMDDLGQKFPEI